MGSRLIFRCWLAKNLLADLRLADASRSRQDNFSFPISQQLNGFFRFHELVFIALVFLCSPIASAATTNHDEKSGAMSIVSSLPRMSSPNALRHDVRVLQEQPVEMSPASKKQKSDSKTSKKSKQSKSKKGKGNKEGKKGKKKSKAKNSPLENLRIYINPFDGRLVSFTVNGTDVTLFGPKGSDLEISFGIEAVSEDGSRAVVEIDETGSVTAMQYFGADGSISIFGFDDQADFLGATLRLPDFNFRGSLTLPPLSSETEDGLETDALNSFALIPPRVSPREAEAEDAVRLRDLQGGSNPGKVQIFAVECNEYVDPILKVTAVSEGNNVPLLSWIRNGVGSYVAEFSVEDTELSADIIGGVCSAINTIGSACPFIAAASGSVLVFYPICASISTALAATGIGAAVAGPAFSACVAGFASAISFCAVYGIGDILPPGAPNPFDVVCNSVAEDLAPFIEDLFFLEEVTVTAEARFAAGDVITGSSTFQPEAGIFVPMIKLEGPGLPELVGFEATPSYPVAGQSYIASTRVVCSRPETVILLEIAGNDGYSDSVTCTGEVAGCNLSVPGAAQFVVDVLTVTITDPLIGKIIDVISLHFR